MPTNKGFCRPDTAKDYFSFEKVHLDGADKMHAFPTTINDAKWAVLTNTNYTDYIDPTITVVCSGLFHKWQERICCLYNDTQEATTGTVYFSGRYFAPINPADTPAAGDQLIWDVSTEMFSTAAGVAGDVLCAVALGAKTTLGANNARKLPAGDYVELLLNSSQTVV